MVKRQKHRFVCVRDIASIIYSIFFILNYIQKDFYLLTKSNLTCIEQKEEYSPITTFRFRWVNG